MNNLGEDYYKMILQKCRGQLPLMPVHLGKEFLPGFIASDVEENDLREIRGMASRGKWKTRPAFREELVGHGRAIVVTDPGQRIIFVSDAFGTMTGYHRSEAKGKIPSFLQGPGTCPKTRTRIRQGLQRGRKINETLLNYRKNGEKYFCNVKIEPVYDIQNRLVNFIAFEKEVAAPV